MSYYVLNCRLKTFDSRLQTRYSFSPATALKIAFIKATMIAKNAAAKKPEVLNEVIMLSTKRIINTVIMKDTRPSVKKLIGKVKSLKMKPIVALASAIRTAAPRALAYPVTSTPGTSFAPIKKASPIKRTSIINLIMFKFVNV
jgi:ribosomal protein L30/L7E